MTDQVAKRLKMEDSSAAAAVTIATHNGHFHADEALAVHMLRQHVPEYAGAQLIRTRDPALLATSHTVVDVGGQYDAAARRFDHHQREFATTFPDRQTKLSSAGLVYMHFGRGIIEREVRKQRQEAAAAEAAKESSEADMEADVDTVYRKLYTSFVEALDAHDNGINAYDPAELEAAAAALGKTDGIQKRFADGGVTLGAMVGRFNANWNDSEAEQSAVREDARFVQASQRIGEEFDRALGYYVKAWLPARSLVHAAFVGRREHDAGGRLLVFRSQSCPWKDHLYTEEEEEEEKEKEKGGDAAEAAARVLYVLYPDRGGSWRVQCVPVSHDSFESRKPLPEAWRGHRDGELDKHLADSGVPAGAVFVHSSGFIGGHKTFEGALGMAKRALEM